MSSTAKRAEHPLGTLLHPREKTEGAEFVQRALRAVREHLGLQVAYASQFIGDRAVYHSVDAPGLEHLLQPGDSRPLDEVYCRDILDGRLPQLMTDTSRYPLAVAKPITAAVPIGAHVSVPLTLPNGEVYGMFCCLGPVADDTLSVRDLEMMRVFADLAAFEIDADQQRERVCSEKVERIARVIAQERLHIVYQPIWSISDDRPIGFESLARFDDPVVQGADRWFAEAADVGLGVELELHAIERALAALAALPDDVYIAVNSSPATVLDPRLPWLLDRWPLSRIVLELTEHNAVDDFAPILDVLTPLRRRGLRVAVDDAGAGYSGLQQILAMHPDLIKLDRSLIHDIGTDPGRRALAAALTHFARDTGSKLIAEGVETDVELAMLRALGVETVQGYLLGYPQPLADVQALLGRTNRRAA
jgi:EAL domain-containing protein (putative c-di-GMP-specific phosphodiesterase class I)